MYWSKVISEGKPHKESAERLDIAPGTAKFLAHQIYTVLGVSNKKEAINVHARVHGLEVIPYGMTQREYKVWEESHEGKSNLEIAKTTDV